MLFNMILSPRACRGAKIVLNRALTEPVPSEVEVLSLTNFE